MITAFDKWLPEIELWARIQVMVMHPCEHRHTGGQIGREMYVT